MDHTITRMDEHLSTESQREEDEEWNDVSDILIQGSNQLSKDEVLLLPGMPLIDIISAIQIMDPRMDVGFGRSKKMTREDNISFDPNQVLLPSEVMTIMDISLACEVSWYSGRLLAQTVLISTYLRHLDHLKLHSNPIIKYVLRAYLLGLTKCCAIVLDEIFKGHLRENEDIHFEHHTIDFNEDIDVSQTLHELDQAYAILNDWPNELEGCRMPLMERLRFRIEFLYSLALLSCSPTTCTISQLENHLLSASEALSCIEFHANSDASISLSDQSDRVKSAFDLNFIQTVSSHSPPRPVEIHKSLYDLIFTTRKIMQDLSTITQIGLTSSISDWITFFQGFSRQVPMAFPFVRSYLLSIFQDGDVIALDQDHTLNWLAIECISHFSAGRVRLEPDRMEMRQILSRLAGLIVNYLSAFAANRPRGHRMLLNSLVEWKTLYNTTWYHRSAIPPSALKTIQTLIYYFSIESSLQIILMGFDLELYEHHFDRLSMWWVVERLSERSGQLLNILSDGQESLEAKMVRSIGQLAAAASQISRKKNPTTPTEDSTHRQTIFERRIKYLTGLHASFEDTHLIDDLNLSRDLLDYLPSIVQSQTISADELDSRLQDVLHRLRQIHIQAHLHKKIGVKQFKFFVHTLIKTTEDLMVKNNETRDDLIPLDQLKISSSSTQTDQLINPKNHQHQHQQTCDVKSQVCFDYQDACSKWFLT